MYSELSAATEAADNFSRRTANTLAMLTRRRLHSLCGNASAHKRQRESFEKALQEAKLEVEDAGTSSPSDIVVKLLRSFDCEYTLLDHDPEWSSQKVCNACWRLHVPVGACGQPDTRFARVSISACKPGSRIPAPAHTPVYAHEIAPGLLMRVRSLAATCPSHFVHSHDRAC